MPGPVVDEKLVKNHAGWVGSGSEVLFKCQNQKACA